MGAGPLSLILSPRFSRHSRTHRLYIYRAYYEWKARAIGPDLFYERINPASFCE